MANLRMRDPLFEGTKVEENVLCRCRVHSKLRWMSAAQHMAVRIDSG